MSKKYKYRQKGEEQKQEESQELTQVSQKPEASLPPDQKIDLHDAARRFVPGFKEHWWAGIKAYAESQGFSGLGTEDQCKTILRRWGAKL